MNTLTGIARFAPDQPAPMVFVFPEDAPRTVYRPNIGEGGAWSLPLPRGEYFVIHQREGCPPAINGPYFVP